MEVCLSSETVDVPAAARACLRLDPSVTACFRTLYRRLGAQVRPHESLRVLGVTGNRSQAGTSTVASRLALAAAENEAHKILLVDANILSPSLHELFAVSQRPGLLEVLRGSQSLEQSRQSTPLDNLWLLPSGSALEAGQGLSANMAELLIGLSRAYDLIVVDLPPADQLLGLTETMSVMDGVLLVIEAATSDQGLSRAAGDALLQTRVLGAVVNKRPSRE